MQNWRVRADAGDSDAGGYTGTEYVRQVFASFPSLNKETGDLVSHKDLGKTDRELYTRYIMVIRTEGISGLLHPFKEHLEGLALQSRAEVLFFGFPKTCTPFVELFWYASRSLAPSSLSRTSRKTSRGG